MVVRDSGCARRSLAVAECTVCVSVPTVDEDAWRALEPGTAHPMQRLRAVRRLRDAGSQRRRADVSRRARFHDADVEARSHDQGGGRPWRRFMGANVLYLKDGTRDHFMGFLAREFPHMVESYQRLYAGAYAAKGYVTDRPRTDRHAASRSITSITDHDG